MWGFLSTALAVFVAIAIGVAAEPMTSTPLLPAPVARAIATTMAVRSVEIRTSFPGASTPAVYQAPDRWEGSVTTPKATAAGRRSARPVIVGDWEDQTFERSPRHEGVVASLRPPPAHLSELFGLPPAREGHAFRRHGDTWTFRLQPKGASTVLTGGSITPVAGLVHSATIDEVEGGQHLVLRSTYSAFNRASRVPTPSQARTA